MSRQRHHFVELSFQAIGSPVSAFTERMGVELDGQWWGKMPEPKYARLPSISTPVRTGHSEMIRPLPITRSDSGAALHSQISRPSSAARQ